jgi:hypothetical protein
MIAIMSRQQKMLSLTLKCPRGPHWASSYINVSIKKKKVYALLVFDGVGIINVVAII